jgi:hypothetical protein
MLHTSELLNHDFFATYSSFPQEEVRSAIQRLNGKVLPKLNWSAPKAG